MSSIAKFRRVLKGQVQTGAAGFTEYWTDAQIGRACRNCRYVWRERFWTPLSTLWAFLLQVLHNGSCREAVALVLGGQAAAGNLPACSADPSAYAQARRRLPLEVLRAGVRHVGRRLRDEVGATITWCGRRTCAKAGASAAATGS